MSAWFLDSELSTCFYYWVAYMPTSMASMA